MLPVGYLVAVWVGCYDPAYSCATHRGRMHALGHEIVTCVVGVPRVTMSTLVATLGVMGLRDPVVASTHTRADQGSTPLSCTVPYTF